MFMFSLAVILTVGLFPFDRGAVRYARPLAVLGLLFAVFHQLLIAGVIPESLKPCTQGVPCSEKAIGLDFARMRADMMAPEIAGVIAQDLADTRTLNVTKTPEFFVNGKPLPSFGYAQLKALVDAALRESERR